MNECKCSGLARTSHLFLGEGQQILVLASDGSDRLLVRAHNGGLLLSGGRPATEVACSEMFPREEAREG